MQPLVSFATIAERLGPRIGQQFARTTDEIVATGGVDDIMREAAEGLRRGRRVMDPVAVELAGPDARHFTIMTGFERLEVDRGVELLRRVADGAAPTGSLPRIASDSLADARAAASTFRDDWSIEHLGLVAPTIANLDGAIARLAAAGV